MRLSASLAKVLSLIYSTINLERLMLVSFMVLWVVWPLRGTIAARNIALVTGAISSLLWIRAHKYKFTFLELLPIYCLFFVPVWLVILYIFNPIIPKLQWGDISGTWLRVILGIFFAIGLAKMLMGDSRYQKFYLCTLFIWPTVVALIYVLQGFFSESWFGEHIYLHILKSKVSSVYFLIWSLTFCFAFFFNYKNDNKNIIFELQIKNNLTLKLLVIILLFICIFDYFFLKSLNAFICLFVCFLTTVFMSLCKKKQNNFRRTKIFLVVISALFIVGFVAIMYFIDSNFYGNKLTNILIDINFIVNHDTSEVWKCGGGGTRSCFGAYIGPYPPINILSGMAVNGSTYERLTWFLEGINFLKLHPFGLGYSGDAFGYYMSQKYLGSDVLKTHSGWLDLALGVGLPGLFAIWVAMGLILRRSWCCMKNSNEYHLSYVFAIWALSLSFILWCIAELSEREYIEHFFFTLAFFSIISIGNLSQKNYRK